MPMSSLFVPTAETSSLRFFLDLMIGLKKPIMFVGGAGVGMCRCLCGESFGFCVACLLRGTPNGLAPGNVLPRYTACSDAAHTRNEHAAASYYIRKPGVCFTLPACRSFYMSACSVQARPSWSKASWHSCLRTWRRCPSASTTSLMLYHFRRSWSHPWRRRSVKPWPLTPPITPTVC